MARGVWMPRSLLEFMKARFREFSPENSTQRIQAKGRSLENSYLDRIHWCRCLGHTVGPGGSGFDPRRTAQCLGLYILWGVLRAKTREIAFFAILADFSSPPETSEVGKCNLSARSYNLFHPALTAARHAFGLSLGPLLGTRGAQ